VGDDAQVKRLIDSVPRVDLLVTCAYATGQDIDIDGGWTAGA
jgi:hypothetical protein